MDEQIRELVQAIHDCHTRTMIVTAGAGAQALSDLLGVAGATRTLLEAVVPYSTAAFNEFLGRPPRKYVTAETARLLAGRAYTRARWLENEPFPLVGLACTATIITDRPKRGDHRAYVATWQPSQLVCYALSLKKGRRDRAGEEDLVSRVILNALARACGLTHQLPLSLNHQELLQTETFDFSQAATRLYQREIDFFTVAANGRIRANNACPPALLSGAFDPLHDGHLELARTAAAILNKPVAFELSVVNVDKPSLSIEVILQRLAQFAGRWPVYASNAPTFAEKARLYPGATFVIGYDTAERVLHPRYYGHSQQRLVAALQEIQSHDCRFLVAGRQDINGVFYTPEMLLIPEPYQNLFEMISAQQFRKDISSTELRIRGKKGSR